MRDNLSVIVLDLCLGVTSEFVELNVVTINNNTHRIHRITLIKKNNNQIICITHIIGTEAHVRSPPALSYPLIIHDTYIIHLIQENITSLLA